MENVKVQGILKSVANLVKSNSNGTMFRTCTVDVAGKTYFAKIWEKSFQNGVTVGDTYTVEMQLDGDTVWLTVLNGSSAKLLPKKTLHTCLQDLLYNKPHKHSLNWGCFVYKAYGSLNTALY
jgi:hypothetical protein